MKLEREKRVSLISFTREGAKLARRIICFLEKGGYSCEGYEKCSRKMEVEEAEQNKKAAEGILQQVEKPLAEWAGEQFGTAGTLVFIGAAGIAVRAVAPWITDKYQDPAVLVVDEQGKFVIPVLSGHVGGGNDFAQMLAEKLSAVAVITTATDIRGCFAVDVFARKKGLWISDKTLAKAVSADVLEGIMVGFYSDFPLIQGEDKPPEGCASGGSCLPACAHNIYLSIFEPSRWKQEVPREGTLQLIPKAVVLGIGCRKGIVIEVLRKEVFGCLKRQGVRCEAVKKVITIEQKKDEAAIKELCREQGWEFSWFAAEELEQAKGEFSDSAFVKQTVGVGNVCERAAALGGGQLLFPKQKLAGITLAASVLYGSHSALFGGK